METQNTHSHSENTSEFSDQSGARSSENRMSRLGSPKNNRVIWWSLTALLIVLVLAVVYKYRKLVIAATVNGKPISRIAVLHELEKQGGTDTLDMLINKRLIADAANDRHISVSDDEINAEIKKYEDQYKSPTSDLDKALAAQHLTRNDLKDQIRIQKQIEKMVSDKVKVSDEEIDKAFKDSGAKPDAGQESSVKDQIKSQLQQEKIISASKELIAELRAKAKINRLVNY